MTARLFSSVVLAWVLASPVDGFAQDSSAAPSRFTVRADATWIGAGQFTAPSDTWLNPDNRTLDLPHAALLGELRANTRLEAGSRLQVVVRPRVQASTDTAAAQSPRATGQGRHARVEMTEAFVSWRPTDVVSFIYGLQNFQWGPAELMSPSNRLFHETGVFRDALYIVRGRHLARVNVSAGKQWSAVALFELGATGEAPFRAGDTFRRAGQAKLEFTTRSGAAYIGATAGVRGGEPPWAGGYAAATIAAGLSAYVDCSVQRGSQAWYPEATAGNSIEFTRSRRNGPRSALALAGVRYSFVSGLDLRLEFLRQGAGYTRASVMAAPRAVASSPAPETIDRWMSPGLEFLGRGLVLASLFAPDLPPAARLDLHARYVGSLTDGSGAAFVTTNVETTGALVVFASLTLTHGPELAEFTRLARAGGVAGLAWSW